MEQSVGTIQEERTRIQLHSNEVTVCIVSLRRELDETRASALTVTSNWHRTRRSTLSDVRWSPATTLRSKPTHFSVLIRSNIQGCRRLSLIPVDQEVSSATLLLYHLVNSLDKTSHQRAPWSWILPYRLTGRSGLRRADACYVWPG